MGTLNGLTALLVVDGVFEILIAATLVIPFIQYVRAFRNYLRMFKLYKTGKFIEMITIIVLATWKIVFNLIGMISFKEYYGFTNLISFFNVFLPVIGSIASFRGIVKQKRRFLNCHFFSILYVLISFFILASMYLSSYTNTFERLAHLVLFSACAVCFGLCGFLIVQINKQVTMNAVMEQRGYVTAFSDSNSDGFPRDKPQAEDSQYPANEESFEQSRPADAFVTSTDDNSINAEGEDDAAFEL
ncbi:hypothetical protein BLNAU_12539 [Blattamonas nauphoetae]|uniref:Transmembrane protein n=1 Tax=Blattamonas nauphoetae TaxID=2049346 RepID=A0ABQ9XJG2_9EUKA|nr:hypothetical protein BLNAU_12539 [Blattamonas nauphoetae]